MLKLMLFGETKIGTEAFSDESKVNLLGSDGGQFVRREAGNRITLKRAEKYTKFGGCLLWSGGCFHLKELVH